MNNEKESVNEKCLRLLEWKIKKRQERKRKIAERMERMIAGRAAKKKQKELEEEEDYDDEDVKPVAQDLPRRASLRSGTRMNGDTSNSKSNSSSPVPVKKKRITDNGSENSSDADCKRNGLEELPAESGDIDDCSPSCSNQSYSPSLVKNVLDEDSEELYEYKKKTFDSLKCRLINVSSGHKQLITDCPIKNCNYTEAPVSVISRHLRSYHRYHDHRLKQFNDFMKLKKAKMCGTKVFVCKHCQTVFTSRGGLVDHLRRKHPSLEKPDNDFNFSTQGVPLVKMQKTSNGIPNTTFACPVGNKCMKQFKTRFHLCAHMRTHLIGPFDLHIKTFLSVIEFLVWKSTMEEKFCTTLLCRRKYFENGCHTAYYTCKHEGYRFPGGDGTEEKSRILTGAKLCTAFIVASMEPDGRIISRACFDHFGHEKRWDLMDLTMVQKKKIACMILDRMTDNHIITFFRNTASEFSRLQYLNKNDLSDLREYLRHTQRIAVCEDLNDSDFNLDECHDQRRMLVEAENTFHLLKYMMKEWLSVQDDEAERKYHLGTILMKDLRTWIIDNGGPITRLLRDFMDINGTRCFKKISAIEIVTDPFQRLDTWDTNYLVEEEVTSEVKEEMSDSDDGYGDADYGVNEDSELPAEVA